nr:MULTISPECIES: hypothetical protein [Legionella]
MNLFAYPILGGFLPTLRAKPIMAGKRNFFAMSAFRVGAVITGKSSQGAPAT